MSKTQVRITCIIVLVTLLGVVIYGETKTETGQKSTVQKDEDTTVTTTNGGNGVGNNEPPTGTTDIDKREGTSLRTGTELPKDNEVTGSPDTKASNPEQEATKDVDKAPSNTDTTVVISRGAGNIHSVTVDDTLYYYTTEELEKGLLHDLKPLAPLFVQAQDKYGIDAVFLAAIAAEESGWGRHQFRKNNVFGFYGPEFESLDHCIDYVANFLLTKYLTPDGKYYKGTSVAAVNTYYNGRDTWEDHVTKIMTNIVNRIERTDSE